MSYESMLALDEHNPRRAVRAHVLDGLQTVRAVCTALTHLPPATCIN